MDQRATAVGRFRVFGKSLGERLHRFERHHLALRFDEEKQQVRPFARQEHYLAIVVQLASEWIEDRPFD